MKKSNHKLLLREDDYRLLLSYLHGGQNRSTFDKRNADELRTELTKAKLVNKEDFPPDVVRLNSKVSIKAADKDDVMQLMVVTPDMADIKERKISVLAPIGTALIGFRQGQEVEWKVPSGRKTFKIVAVENQIA